MKIVFIRHGEPDKSIVDARGYRKIAVVAHGGVIRRYTGVGLIAHGEVCEIEYTPDFVPFGWI